MKSRQDELASQATELAEAQRLALIRKIAATVTPRRIPTIAELQEVLSGQRSAGTFAPGQGDMTIAGFASWLNAAFGRDNYPPSLAGDLADLLETLELIYAALASFSLSHVPTSPDAVADQLFQLRINLTDDLPMLFADINTSIDAVIGKIE
jgi:hypothetical protein